MRCAAPLSWLVRPLCPLATPNVTYREWDRKGSLSHSTLHSASAVLVAWPDGRASGLLCRARYEDARFFYTADRARPLASFRPLLDGITFQVAHRLSLLVARKIAATAAPRMRKQHHGRTNAADAVGGLLLLAFIRSVRSCNCHSYAICFAKLS